MNDYKIGDTIFFVKNGVATSDKIFSIGCSPTLGIFYNKTIMAKDAFANIKQLIKAEAKRDAK